MSLGASLSGPDCKSGILATLAAVRRAILLTILLLAVPLPGAAFAQGSNPFGPVQSPAQPPPAPELPEPEAPDEEGDDDGLGGTAFWMIIGTTGLLFAGIAFLITRDMRKTAGTRRKAKRRTRGTGRPAADAAESIAAESHRSGSQRARAKAQKRAKTKAARKQRRRSRSR